MDKPDFHHDMCEKVLIFLLAATISLAMFVTCDDDLEPSPNNEENAPVTEGSDDTVADVKAGNSQDHEEPGDYIWDNAGVIQIVLNGNSISVDATGIITEGSKVTITSAGTYSISGTLADGQVIVDTKDEETVRLILNGGGISCSASAPIYIKNAEKTIIILAENTENHVTDGDNYIFEDGEEDEPNAAIFSKADLTFCGSGSLTVEGNFNDGIASKDGLIIKSGAITVNAADDGIRGKDYLIVRDGDITVNAGGDGLKSDNDEDTTLGYILIETGIFNITSGGDALAAETDVMISDGEINIITGGGSSSRYDESKSVKGIKGVASVIIDGGNFTVNAADDALHSNRLLVINGGNFSLSTGDDAMHADTCLGINGGDINITKSYEGIESDAILINSGNIHIVSSDDGINAAGGDAANEMNGWPPGPGGGGANNGNSCLYINDGYIVVDAAGDGIDANGSIEMTGGTVIINGPTANNNGALDHMSFRISGGFLLAAGSSGMAQAPDGTSTQYSVLLNLRSSQKAGTMVHVQTTGGVKLFSFQPSKQYQSIAFSLPELKKDQSYDVYFGGSSTGTAVDGLCQDGTYIGGNKYTSFTISSTTTQIKY